MSHPSRVRGLKRATTDLVRSMSIVAPLAGAWIETLTRAAIVVRAGSHPSRVRGLKLVTEPVFNHAVLSHPSRVRGLKRLCEGKDARSSNVAPLAGAWIETLSRGF